LNLFTEWQALIINDNQALNGFQWLSLVFAGALGVELHSRAGLFYKVLLGALIDKPRRS
jgi:p-aminobenzoyl-glutamate transporter AbgT